MKLEAEQAVFYRLKKGQNLFDVANFFHLPPRVLAAFNELTEEPKAGTVLKIPAERRDLYTVHGGESKALLCGSKENFELRNKTEHLYLGQTVFL